MVKAHVSSLIFYFSHLWDLLSGRLFELLCASLWSWVAWVFFCWLAGAWVGVWLGCLVGWLAGWPGCAGWFVFFLFLVTRASHRWRYGCCLIALGVYGNLIRLQGRMTPQLLQVWPLLLWLAVLLVVLLPLLLLLVHP